MRVRVLTLNSLSYSTKSVIGSQGRTLEEIKNIWGFCLNLSFFTSPFHDCFGLNGWRNSKVMPGKGPFTQAIFSL